MLTKRSVGADRPPQNNAWLDHGRGDNCWVMGLLGEPSLELTRFETPGSRGRIHGWRCDGQIEKTYGGLIGLEFPRHSSRISVAPRDTKGERAPVSGGTNLIPP